jgi:DNA-directed RNA polymerase subunit RPC12/RpoP
MPRNFRFTLSRREKHICPHCGKKRFVRYRDTTTDQYIDPRYGKCDRSDHCGYYLNPYDDGYAKSIIGSSPFTMTYKNPMPIAKARPEPAFIPIDILQSTIRNGYEQNVFIQNLLKNIPFPFDEADITEVISLYRLGTVVNGYRAGGITFPFIDERGNIRAIQVKQFDQANHTTGTDFLTSIIEKHHEKKGIDLPEWLKAYQKNDLKVSCLFGAHLLTRYPKNRIALVEAPKTAIYGTLYFGLPKSEDDLLWLAVYSKDTLNLERCKCLKGRTVYLFPDLSKDGSTFELWHEKAQEISKHVQGLKIITSDVLEKLATQEQKDKGADLADYLISLDWRLFRGKAIGVQPKQAAVNPERNKALSEPIIEYNENTFHELPPYFILPGLWDEDIKAIDDWLKNNPIIMRDFMLNAWTPVSDPYKFIEANLETARANNGNPVFKANLTRVQELIKFLNSTLYERTKDT